MMQVFTGIICDFGRTADCPPPPAIGGFCKVLFILMFVLLLVYASVTHFLGTHLWLAMPKNLHPEFTWCESFFGFKNIILPSSNWFRSVFASNPNRHFRGDATVGAQVARRPTSKSSKSFGLRWGCFIAGMSFACLQPAHHAHHVWVRQTKRVTSWMIRTRGIAPGEKLHNDL